MVAMLHSDIARLIPEIIGAMSLFRMPLFFFLSGIFFSYASDPKTFFLKKIEALLKPYFSVLIFLFIASFFLPFTRHAWGLVGILYGSGETIVWNPMWFLTHLFAVYCFCYLLLKYTHFDKFSRRLKFITLCLMILLGAQIIDTFWQKTISLSGYTFLLPGLPFSIDIILISSTYFLAGFFLRKKVIHYTPSVNYLTISILIYVAVVQFTHAHINFALRSYSSPIFATIGAICGIYFILATSWYLTKFNIVQRTLSTLGAASLYILIFHLWIGAKAQSFFSMLLPNPDLAALSAIAAYTMSIFVPVGMKWIIEKIPYFSLFFLPIRTNKLFKSISYKPASPQKTLHTSQNIPNR